MPSLNLTIPTVWTHANEPDKIHYTVVKTDGSRRHLVAKRGSALFTVLRDHLDAIGYTGPKTEEKVSADA